MQVQPINRAALRRYLRLKTAVTGLVRVLEHDAARFVAKVNDAPGGYTVPSREEVDAARVKALASVVAMNRATRAYEAELVSRAWRV